VLYVGITSDLDRRLAEHKSLHVPGFTAQYNCTELVYFEDVPDVKAAIAREKQLKKWRRSKKEALIRLANPGARDLSASLEMTGE